MINVAVIVASGYTGLELIKMIVKHPNFNLAYVATSEGNITLSELHPSLSGVVDCDVEKADAAEVAKSCELAFLALPHKTAMGFVKELMTRNVKVVDLSADYRLEQERYEQHYVPHIDTETSNMPSTVCRNSTSRRSNQPGWWRTRAVTRPLRSWRRCRL